MLYKLIILQFTAHLLSDFIFQSQKWSDKKGEKIFTKHHLLHVSVVFVFSYILSLDFNFWYAALILTVFHLFTDILKSFLQLKNPDKNYFFMDQLIHVIILVLISVGHSKFSEINFIVDLELKTIAIVSGLIFCTKPANIFIKYIFIAFSIKAPEENSTDESDDSVELAPEEKSLPNAGKLIGIIERLLAFSLILSGQYGAVGLIIAAKSILRFNDTQKAEYVLVGTLLSFGFAALLGITTNLL
jgi:hypothetical protein